MNKPTQIFVDGNCIVCDWEISKYKKMAPEEFDLIDIAAADFVAQKYGLTAEAVNKHIHVFTPEGQVLKGVDAFAHIWSRLPKMKWASHVIQWPVIHPLALLGYEVFARNRHRLPKKK
jgi:predicted DCC family thiol-disulfide oxidoreductase YuxK